MKMDKLILMIKNLSVNTLKKLSIFGEVLILTIHILLLNLFLKK